MSVKMLCFLVLAASVMIAEVKAGREIRSPGGNGWQGSGGGFGSARSSLGGWSGSASGRSQWGWNGLGRSGGNGDYSGFSGRSSGCGSSGWDSSSGFRSNGGGYSNW